MSLQVKSLAKASPQEVGLKNSLQNKSITKQKFLLAPVSVCFTLARELFSDIQVFFWDTQFWVFITSEPKKYFNYKNITPRLMNLWVTLFEKNQININIDVFYSIQFFL